MQSSLMCSEMSEVVFAAMAQGISAHAQFRGESPCLSMDPPLVRGCRG